MRGLNLHRITVVVLALSAAGALHAEQPCTLQVSVLAPYDAGAAATLEQWRASREAVSRAMGCPALDSQSRKIFYAVVEREFETDHRAALAQWQATRPGSEALWEALHIHQRELRDFMERTFEPHRDAAFAPVVLKYGTAPTIASLGPSVRDDVLHMLGLPERRYGVAGQYSAQITAMDVIGYWIDPANTAFAPAEKAKLTSIATGLLAESRDVRRGHHYQLVETALKSLGRSADLRAESAIRAWMATAAPNAPLYKIAARAAKDIRKKAKPNG
jgi:hypothetical protein